MIAETRCMDGRLQWTAAAVAAAPAACRFVVASVSRLHQLS